MLVLSRVVGEMISIGDNITVRILAVNGNHVRFGVEAPKHVNVHRAEIYRRILTKVEPGVPSHDIRDPVA